MTIETTTISFDHQRGGDFPGDRGEVFEAVRPFASFDRRFPALWLDDAGEVEISECGRFPAEDVLAWLEAAAEVIRSRASEPVLPDPLPVHVNRSEGGL